MSSFKSILRWLARPFRRKTRYFVVKPQEEVHIFQNSGSETITLPPPHPLGGKIFDKPHETVALVNDGEKWVRSIYLDADPDARAKAGYIKVRL